jgi:hypothetical protein
MNHVSINFETKWFLGFLKFSNIRNGVSIWMAGWDQHEFNQPARWTKEGTFLVEWQQCQSAWEHHSHTYSVSYFYPASMILNSSFHSYNKDNRFSPDRWSSSIFWHNRCLLVRLLLPVQCVPITMMFSPLFLPHFGLNIHHIFAFLGSPGR